MKSTLYTAKLFYGTSVYPVESNDTLPFPKVFDFVNVELCAKKILAILSNASGGHTIRDCYVRYHQASGRVICSGNGASAVYRQEPHVKLPVDELIKIESETLMIKLGDVTTDQYGDGWKRAKWKNS